MTDLALILQDGLSADIAFDGDFITDEGLRTAVLISVLTDARASEDDLKRFNRAGEDARGVWWDTIAPVTEGDNTGSLLWLLTRAKQTEENRRIARDMISASLAWMIEDQVAKAIDVTVQFVGIGLVAWRARITKIDGTRFDVEWQATLKETN
ncbi:MAG: hypothetical protein GC184_14585 [Rhizobiales bacterium]|nr:hypothetical protein [Hyphomicrobiales bacterium]